MQGVEHQTGSGAACSSDVLGAGDAGVVDQAAASSHLEAGLSSHAMCRFICRHCVTHIAAWQPRQCQHVAGRSVVLQKHQLLHLKDTFAILIIAHYVLWQAGRIE